MPRAKRQDAIKLLDLYGYDFLKSSNTDRVERLVSRAKRDLISYDKRTVSELRESCQRRKLSIPVNAAKDALLKLLENADEDAHFDYFPELPAELRVRVYQILFEYEYNSNKVPFSVRLPSSSAQHAITKASRLLRQEVLPVFYDTVRARIAAGDETFVDPTWRNPLSQSLRTAVSSNYAVTLNGAPELVVAEFKKILLDVQRIQRDGGTGDGSSWLWEIDLADKGREAKVRCIRRDDNSYRSLSRTRQYERETEARILKVLREMAAGEGEMTLQKKDVKAFIRAVKLALEGA